MKCRKCNNDVIGNGRICSTCLNEWTNMRALAFTTLTNVHGPMTQSNHPIFKKEMKRLENIWRKDTEKFQCEIEKLTPPSPDKEGN